MMTEIMAEIETLLFAYGPIVVLIGTFFEGETIVALAGFAAHQGFMNPFAVAAAAFAGSFAGDQLWFWLGRRHADHPWVRRLAQRPSFLRALGFIEKYPVAFICSFRFLYGIRTVSPVAIGFTNVPLRKFLVLNALSAAVWAAAFTTLGFLSGKAIESTVGELSAIEHKALAAVAVIAVVFTVYQLVRRYLRKRSRI